ncbi:acyltransferase [soil metagenome]
MLTASLGSLIAISKWTGIALAMMIVALPAATCWLEGRLSSRDEAFLFWGQALSLVPGLPGKYLRKCYYFLTLQSCSLSCDIGFMSYFNDRRSKVGRRVYIGFGVGLGLVTFGDGVLIGSRASVLSGGKQHRLGSDGRLTPFQRSSADRVRIGAETWIGEAAVVMADVGNQCIVGAASVVSRPMPDGCLVVGNPARFVRKLTEDGSRAAQESEKL